MTMLVMQKDDEIAAFVAERDAMLIDGDLDAVEAFFRKHNPNMATSSSRKVTEIMLHKARTAALSLPKAMRRASKHWLERRGYKSFDDGDL